MREMLRKVGDDFVVVLPPAVVERLGWGSGDTVQASVEGSAIKLVRTQTKHDRAMEIAEQVMDEYQDVFQALAKT